MSLLLFFVGASAAAPQPQPQPAPAPAVVPQPAGGVYAPVRKRKPTRLVFLEQEIREKLERERELKALIKATEGRAREAQAEEIRQGDLAAIKALDRNIQELYALQATIAALQMEIAQFIKLQEEQDEDDAITVIIAATLH